MSSDRKVSSLGIGYVKADLWQRANTDGQQEGDYFARLFRCNDDGQPAEHPHNFSYVELVMAHEFSRLMRRKIEECCREAWKQALARTGD
jgi:hypothetical protein